MTIESSGKEAMPIPQIDREYVEIYPVNWAEFGDHEVKDIFTSRSKEGISEISLYFHIPFCPVLCPFCKFNITEYDNSAYKEYISAVRSEVSRYKGHPDLQDRKVTAIYIGGGTGSMIKPNDLGTILSDVSKIFPLDAKPEITVESHPNTVGKKRFQEYLDVGVNRVSLGIQSFQDENLKAIGRNHSAERNREVLSAALETGFDSVAMDLMYRLPNQTFKNLETDLQILNNYKPQGVSVYSLGIEGTDLENKIPEIATDQVDKAFFYLIRDLLQKSGYSPFMQPDFSLPNKECRYVVNAWMAPQQLMLSFGAGAHTHYFGGHNWSNVYPVGEYINAIKKGLSPIAVGTKVSEKELMAKYMVLGARAISVSKNKFEELFNCEIQDIFSQEISYLRKLGWIEDRGDEYEITREGIYYVDNISKIFYTPENRTQNQPRGKELYNFVPKSLRNSMV